MASRRIALLSLCIALLVELSVACGGGGVQPVITSVTPSTALHNTAIAPLAVTGRNFLSRYAPDASSPSGSKEVGSWSVVINGVAYPANAVSTTRLEASIPAVLSPRLYDITATNPEVGTATLTTALFVSGPYYLVVGSAAEPAPGTANRVTIPVTFLDARFGATTFDQALTLPVDLSSPSAGAPPLSLTSGMQSATLLVLDSRAEEVAVAVNTTASATGLLSLPGLAQFIPGPASMVHIRSVSGGFWNAAAHTGTALGMVTIDDLWNNRTVTNTAYSGTLAVIVPNSCTLQSYGADPASFSIGVGGTAFEFRAWCTGASTQPSYFQLQLQGTSPAYANSTGLLTF